MPGGIQPPLEQWLKWPVPNYHDPPTRAPVILILSCVIGPISIALLCTRLWVRVHLQRNAGVDDWLMLASLFPIIALTVILPLVTEKYRFNRHVWDAEPEYWPIQRKFVMAIYSIFTLASGLVKLSVLLFYRRLSTRAVSPIFKWIMRIMIVTIICYTIAFIVVLSFTCQPFSAWWQQVNFALQLLPGGYQYHCINEGADVVANGIVATVQDFIVATLPTILCWRIQIPIRQKIALYSIFLVSYSTVAIGAMRTWTTYLIYFETYDVTWVANDTFLFSLLELHIGTMCANAPSLKVFLKQVAKSERVAKLISSRSSKSRSNGSSKQHPSADPNATAVSDKSAWITIAFWKSQHSRNTNGYVSEANTHVEIDKHGGIVTTKAQGDFEDNRSNEHIISSPFPSSPEYRDVVISPYHRGHDVEMGDFPSPGRYNRRSEIRALPPCPPPKDKKWLQPIRGLSPFPKQ